MGVWARGASKKVWDPLLISATVDSGKFKFGTELDFEKQVAKNHFLDQIWQGSGLGEHPKKF